MKKSLKRIDIREVASILDEDIQKAELKLPRTKVEKFEEEISKALSFNPMFPHDMSAESPYYNPYRQLEDGTFAPYETQHWVGQGKKADGYRTTDDFYRQAGVNPSSSFRRSMSEQLDLFKAEAPVGTVKRHADGTVWRKITQGRGKDNWQLVTDPRQAKQQEQGKIRSKKPEAPGKQPGKQQPNQSKNGTKMESGADTFHKEDQVATIRAELEKRKKEEKAKVDNKKQTIQTVRDAFKDLPDFNKISDKLSQMEVDATIPKELQEKTKRREAGKGHEVELSEEELATLLEHGKFAFISAGKNPKLEKDMKTDEEAQRYEQLRKDLQAKGYVFTKVTGHYEGEEDSFLVMAHDADRNDFLDLGKKYNQDSVIYGEKGKQEMHFTTGENEGKVYIGDGWAEAPEADDFYSSLRTKDGDFKFSLNFDFDKLHDWADIKDQPDLVAGGKVVEAKAPGDGDRPTNGLDKNEAYTKAGKSLTRDEVESFIKEFESDFNNLSKEMDDAVRSAGATEFAGRLKDGASLLGKMTGRLSDRSLNTITDVIGTRALTDSIDKQKEILKAITDKYETVEVDESVDKARPDGYRAVHVLFRTPSGKIGELQIKTHRQQVYSGFTHDTIYKGKDEIKNNPEVKQYTRDLSDYLYSLDKGSKDEPSKRPVEPEILAQNEIMFPWNELEKISKSLFSDLFKADSKIKFYVTIRDKKKQNGNTHEFESFKDAKKFRDDMRKNGHDGELPIGHGRSKEEYLKTFSEYRKGPGSKGGNVVGYTKSGKAKYAKKSFQSR